MKSRARWGLGAALLATLVAAYFAPPAEGEDQLLSERASRPATARGASTATATPPAQRPVARGQDRGDERPRRAVAEAGAVQVLAIRPRTASSGGEGEEGDEGGEWFVTASRAKPVAVVAPPPPAPVVVAPPQAPALPFRPFGRYVDGGEEVIFLMHNDQNLAVRVGDVIGQHYRVEGLDGSRLTLRYLPLDQTQTLDLGGASN